MNMAGSSYIRTYYEKEHCIEAGFIYHCEYFHQVMIIPDRSLKISLMLLNLHDRMIIELSW
jgi:hypothetical protein